MEEKLINNSVSKLNTIKVLALINGLFLAILDQVTKYSALNNLEYLKTYPIFNILTDKLNFGFNWFLTYNYGTAFSFIKAVSGYKTLILALSSTLVTLLLLFWLYKEQENNKITILSIGAIIGGALGNIYDRLTLGYVVDFIDVYAGQYHWPIFNLADMAISIGVVLLITQIFTAQKS